jgi:hypothetical protein
MAWNDVLGWAGSALLVWSLVQTRLIRLRVWNLVGSVALIVFNSIAHVWPMVGLNVVLAGINVYYLVTLTRSRHDDRRYVVVPVGLDDAFLAHTLRVHATDIARFNPGFSWRGPRPGRWAYLVAAGDEVVGMVIGRTDAEDAHIARVELDYVIPKYRDFTPGEFVYRHSDLFTERGFVAPYYAKLGFQRAGDSFCLDLA